MLTEGLGICLKSIASDSSCELHVLWHDCISLGVDGTDFGVLEETREVRLSSLMEGKESRALESNVILKLKTNLSNESLEGDLFN